jgi:hypothetical protein
MLVFRDEALIEACLAADAEGRAAFAKRLQAVRDRVEASADAQRLATLREMHAALRTDQSKAEVAAVRAESQVRQLVLSGEATTAVREQARLHRGHVRQMEDDLKVLAEEVETLTKALAKQLADALAEEVEATWETFQAERKRIEEAVRASVQEHLTAFAKLKGFGDGLAHARRRANHERELAAARA